MNKVDLDIASLFFDNNVSFDIEKEKQKFIDHMSELQSLSVEESTLYRKWQQLQKFNNTKDIIKSAVVKQKIWSPRDIGNFESTMEDIDNLFPEIVIVDNDILEEDWFYLRNFVSSFEFKQNVGRLIKVLIRDKLSDRYLGIASLGSDVTNISVRDSWIGWSNEDKFEGGRLRNTAITTTLVPTQPFGYNFLGGKLVASLICTEKIRNEWESRFGDVLVGITTTSLYGSHSMYQRIPFWKELGKTTGRMPIKPDERVYKMWMNWVRDNCPEDFDKCTIPQEGFIEQNGTGWSWKVDSVQRGHAPTREELIKVLNKNKYNVHSTNEVYDRRSRNDTPPTGPKNRILNVIYKNLELSQGQFEHGFKRGVYFAPLYENMSEFLRGKINKSELVPSPKLSGDTESVMGWWKPKAIKRYTNIFEKNNVKPEILYYRDMIQMDSWGKVKQTYMSEVGR